MNFSWKLKLTWLKFQGLQFKLKVLFDSQHNSGFIVAPQNWSTTSPNAEGVNKKGQSSWLQKTPNKQKTLCYSCL